MGPGAEFEVVEVAAGAELPGGADHPFRVGRDVEGGEFGDEAESAVEDALDQIKGLRERLDRLESDRPRH